ncbi:class I SAM-dependent methyltransferase [Kitasatospora sp. NPDC051914]|uniref:class I SAM-dependent methyltransferase n=1 Tax=Kitasatospora sp. NPDC051914 TaxID=3154945 RepID=UPI00341C6DA0
MSLRRLEPFAVPLLEISDLVVVRDPVTAERLPVRKDGVVAELLAAGDRRGARIAAAMPAVDGVLDPLAVDRRLVAVHTELQRLSEELRIGDRLADLLVPLLAAVRAERADAAPLRVVDIGCGLGYLVRRLAADGRLGADVELVGVDLNAALVTEAERLARDEELPCRFVHGDAFRLPEPATVYVSTGLLHHIRGAALEAFFAAQAGPGTAAFCHFDIAANSLAPIGAWVFHRARMRDPLGRHDGVVSAQRAHGDAELLQAAAHAGPLVPLLYEPRGRSNPFCTTLRPVLGVRPELEAPFRAALGPRGSARLVGAA